MLQYGIEIPTFLTDHFRSYVFNQTLMGCSSLNIDGVSKRVTYSEFVNKMLQYGIEKSNFPDGPF